MITDERLYKLALTNLEGVGTVLAKHLLSYCGGSAQKVLQLSRGKLLKIPGIGEKTATSIAQNHRQALILAENELTLLEKNPEVKLIFHDEPCFPKRLKRFADGPYKLYVKGELNSNPSKSIAIVGTRRASEYGKSVCEGLVKYLSDFKDITIVSGLAYGIDIAAHRACLEHNVHTVAVMANGIDTVYPSQHKSTAEKICANGALLSENELGTMPDASKFPQRNRIIAALSDAVIVVEAFHKGGALITAKAASEYGIEVFAVPGNIDQPFSKGCNNLIAQNLANPLVDFSDLPKNLNWDGKLTVFQPEDVRIPLDELNSNESLIYQELMSAKVLSIDMLSIRTGITVSELASLLTLMEFNGYLISMPGKQFKIK